MKRLLILLLFLSNSIYSADFEKSYQRDLNDLHMNLSAYGSAVSVGRPGMPYLVAAFRISKYLIERSISTKNNDKAIAVHEIIQFYSSDFEGQLEREYQELLHKINGLK